MRHALDIFSFEGRVTRRGYLFAGLLLFAIKYPIDLIISQLTRHEWNPLMYLSPRVSPLFAPQDDPVYWIALLVWSLPFMWAGVSLTARRLRDVGVHPFWAGLFFAPFVHYALFAALVIAPSKAEPAAPPTPDAGPFRESSAPPLPLAAPPKFLTRAIPSSKGLAYLFGLLLSLVMGLVCYVIAVQINRSLGTLLFIGLPFGMGFSTAFCVSYGRSRVSGWGAVGYGVSALFVAFVLLLALTWEGLACIVMAFPLVAAVAALGAWIGWLCARNPPLHKLAPLLVLAIPLLIGADILRPHQPEALSVVSTVTVAAPPETVWRNVVSFPPIDARPAPIFAIVAMPLEARIDGHDPGATRRCVFTNGTFIEPIEVWDEPRELRFGVEKQPDNLDEYIEVTRGQFLLTANSDGSTTLRGTTWYRLKVFPSAYWSAWAQTFLHAIHLRVLDHVKRLSEHPDLPRAAHAAALPSWMEASNATCACTRHKK